MSGPIVGPALGPLTGPMPGPALGPLTGAAPGAALAPVGAGELIDRIAILRLKVARFTDPARRGAASAGLAAPVAARQSALAPCAALEALAEALLGVNAALWDIENALRAHEAQGDFGPGFVAPARSVYQRNDRRAAIKAAISALCADPLAEGKEHPPH